MAASLGVAVLFLCSIVAPSASFSFSSISGLALKHATTAPLHVHGARLPVPAVGLRAGRFPSLGLRQTGGLRMMADAEKPLPRLVVGVNKYSHDTSICIARQDTGEVLMIWSKERHSRRKHDGGDIASLLETALENLQLSLDHVELVVSNNHHFRVRPYEQAPKQLAWSAHLGHVPETYTSEFNLLPNAKHKELSHHLAHAWSAAAQAPFDSGLVVVMDGMGESFDAMASAEAGGGAEDASYVSDLRLSSSSSSSIPRDVAAAAAGSAHGFREGETVYTFRRDPAAKTLAFAPVLKRWQQERTPPTLYNFGFENMESAGAVYSRVSSAVFGDWNACGKVMGLAPWHSVWSHTKGAEADDSSPPTVMEGRLTSAEPQDWTVAWDVLRQTPFAGAKFEVDAGLEGSTEGSETARAAAKLSAGVQRDLETVGMDMVRELKEQTGETNLVLCGGVGLNSVLNGRLQRELGFEQTYIPPYPGDDGIAVGCCAYGLYGEGGEQAAPLWEEPLSPYMGPVYTDEDVLDALEAASGWIEYEEVADEERRIKDTAAAVAFGEVVAWWTGRSEAGPRALGHRSLLADPRNASMVTLINSVIKHREAFRPFAPSVLAEHAHDWFESMPEGEAAAPISPYMSVTVKVLPEKRSKIPSVTHVDGTSRLQTVTAAQEPLYYRLIAAFFALTGVPMVLNTSFNTIRSEPITETPADAIRSFLATEGAVDRLVLSRWVVRRKPSPVLPPLDIDEVQLLVPVPAGPYQLETTEAVTDGYTAVTRVRLSMPASVRAVNDGWVQLTDSLESAVLEMCDGETIIGEIIQAFVEDGDFDEDVEEEDVMERLHHLYDNCLVSFQHVTANEQLQLE